MAQRNRSASTVAQKGIALTALALWLAACNGILGIDEATLDPQAPGGASSGSGGQSSQVGMVIPKSACSATLACQSCLTQSCSAVLLDCLGDSACRRALDDYRACLERNACRDNTDQECAEALSFVVPLGRNLVSCAFASCSTQCKDSPLAGECDLYCSCMPEKCPGKVEQSDLAACRSKCTALGNSRPDLPWCRWNHCEFPSVPDSAHCEHAIGNSLCTDTGSALTPCANKPDKTISGLPCRQNSDCCSGICSNEVCSGD